MITAELDEQSAVLHIRPSGPLEKADFVKLAALADPYIAKHGGLAGLLIEARSFPGWKNLAGMLAHFRFVRGHHRRIRKVAVVTDAAIGKVAERIARHFIAAEVKRFGAGELRQAKQWIGG
jgi:SpoIIAA-like